MVSARVGLGTVVVASATVLGAASCGSGSDSPGLPEINLPARRRDPGKGDAGVLEAADSGDVPVEAGPPPDPFCTEPDLALCLAFEGSLADGSPSALSPSTENGVAFVPGKKGEALKLDAPTEIRFAPADVIDVKAATVEAWVYRDPISFGDDTVFDADARFAMTVEQDGTLRCNTAIAAARGGEVPIAQWVHVACTFDGAKIAGYVNGMPAATASSAITTGPSAGAAIGDNAPEGGEQLLGMIDQLRVFSVARTAAQIAAAAKL